MSGGRGRGGMGGRKEMVKWEGVGDLKRKREEGNVVVDGELVDGKYGLYRGGEDGLMDRGCGGGMGWGVVDDMSDGEMKEEKIMNGGEYDRMEEVKKGEGGDGMDGVG